MTSSQSILPIFNDSLILLDAASVVSGSSTSTAVFNTQDTTNAATISNHHPLTTNQATNQDTRKEQLHICMLASVTVRSKFSTNSASVQGANIEAISTVCKIIPS
jgi:hypothetical protein